jgi:hypothetical protein
MTPDFDLATHLATQGLGTVSTDIFAGPQRPSSAQIPQAVIFCISSGGSPPVPYLDGSSSDFSAASVQVLVRGDVGAYAAAQVTARLVMVATQRAVIGGYVAVYVNESDPNFLGLDDTEHPMFSINAIMQWKG